MICYRLYTSRTTAYVVRVKMPDKQIYSVPFRRCKYKRISCTLILSLRILIININFTESISTSVCVWCGCGCLSGCAQVLIVRTLIHWEWFMCGFDGRKLFIRATGLLQPDRSSTRIYVVRGTGVYSYASHGQNMCMNVCNRWPQYCSMLSHIHSGPTTHNNLQSPTHRPTNPRLFIVVSPKNIAIIRCVAQMIMCEMCLGCVASIIKIEFINVRLMPTHAEPFWSNGSDEMAVIKYLIFFHFIAHSFDAVDDEGWWMDCRRVNAIQ